jgi:RNA polymerase Rpc34 subunit
MLEGLEPSIALTGGPWYTDNELDTEFIQHLMDACYKFISDIVRTPYCLTPSRRLLNESELSKTTGCRRGRTLSHFERA